MPKMRWHPETGENTIFGDDETPPEDYLDYHPADAAQLKAKAPPAAPPIKPLTKGEVTEALALGNIEFDKNAKIGALTELLVASLKAALAAADKPYADDMAPRTLLELVTGA